jgi:hypothetical protein
MKIRYQNNIVAFIDVLGFSNIVYSATTQKLQEYFNHILIDFKQDVEQHHFKYLLISDSVVITAKNNIANLEVMIKSVAKLQAKLLTKKILIRGGISQGNLYVNKSLNIIVGDGLINAYKLESKAKYPRVIIDRSFIKRYYSDTKSLLEKYDTWVDTRNPETYEDDYIFINYIQTFILVQQTNKLENVFEWLKEQLYQSDDYFQKYNWIIKQLLKTMSAQLKRYYDLDDKTTLIRARIRKVEMFLNKYNRL